MIKAIFFIFFNRSVSTAYFIRFEIMVNEKYICVLENLTEKLCQQYVDPELLYARFGTKYLNKDEICKIRNSGTRSTQIIEFCDMLKPKPDDIFLELKELAVVQKWDEVFNFLQSQLIEVNFNLMPKEDPILLYREEKPYLFEISGPSPGFTGRQNQLEEIHKIINEFRRTRKSLVISGLGGIGKSQLVLFYIQKHKLDFDSIIWFHAKSEASLKASVSRLCSVLDKEVDQQVFEVVAKTVARKVSQFGNKNFLIFDNVDNFSPWEILPKEFKTHFSIITSRPRNWDKKEYKTVKLECLTEEEAVDFVRTSLPDLENIQKDGVLELVLALERFPLALTQAISYIKMKMQIHTKYNFKDYLSEFQSNTKNANKLLNRFPNELENDYNLVTYTTWQITFNELVKIHYESNRNEESVKPENFETKYKSIPNIIMNIIAYLASDNIPTNLFLDVANGDEDYLSWAISVLEKYSLIVVSHGMIKTHKLVQQVTRLKLLDENKIEEFVTAATDLLLKKFPPYDNQSENISLQLSFLPHLLQLKHHVEYLEKHNHVNKENTFSIYPNLLVCIGDVCIVTSEPRLGKQICNKLLEILEVHGGADHFEVAITFANLANAYNDFHKSQTQKRMLEKALKILELNYGANHFEVAITLANLATAYDGFGELQMQETMLERALKILELHYGADNFEAARKLTNLAIAYCDFGKPQMQKRMLEKVLKIQELHYGADHFEVATTLLCLATVYGALGEPQMQKRMLEKAVKIQELYYGANHFEVATTLLCLATAYGALGEQQMQKRMLEKALKIQELYYGANHIKVATMLLRLAITYSALGESQMQKTMLEKALKIQELYYGANNFEVATTTRVSLANVYGALGEPQMQIKTLEKALKIHELYDVADDFEVATTLVSLANAYGALGEPQMQKKMLEKVLKIQELYYGANNFEVATTLVSLAFVYSVLGEPQKQKMMLEKALKIQELHYGTDHYVEATTLVSLANAYGALGEPKMQKKMLEKALKIQELYYATEITLIIQNLDYGTDLSVKATNLVSLANAYGALGEPQMQKKMLEKALKIQELHYAANHYEKATTLVNLANMYDGLGEPQTQKNTMLEKALKIKNLHFAAEYFKLAITVVHLGNAHGAFDVPQMQRRMLEQALKILEHWSQYFGTNCFDHFEVARTLANLANAYGDLGKPQTQKTMLEKALKIKELHYGTDHFEVAITLANLANAYGALGEPQTQKTMLEKALKILVCYGCNNYQVGSTRYFLAKCCMRLKYFQEAKDLLENVVPIFSNHYGETHFYTKEVIFKFEECKKLLTSEKPILRAIKKCIVL